MQDIIKPNRASRYDAVNMIKFVNLCLCCEINVFAPLNEQVSESELNHDISRVYIDYR